MVWWVVRGSTDAVRYQPPHLALVIACAASQPGVPEQVGRWLAATRARPAVVKAAGMPHALVRLAAAWAARWFGPTGSALVRWLSGAVAATADGLTAGTIERSLRARAHPGLLVPHPHSVAVLAADMRGFSNLTQTLDDTQYLSDLVSDYLTELTGQIETHRGVVFQYTGDGLFALFLPELSGSRNDEMLERLVGDLCPALHRTFDGLHERWRTEWRARGCREVKIGLGVGLSFGRATIGFIGPSGKKQFGVIGSPVNLAAFLCAGAEPGSMYVDCASFERAGATRPNVPMVRLRSKKVHQRIETLRFGRVPRRRASALRWVQA
jgi:class 3 adenylate cyclase